MSANADPPLEDDRSVKLNTRRNVDDEPLVPSSPGHLRQLVVRRKRILLAQESFGELWAIPNDDVERLDDDAGLICLTRQLSKCEPRTGNESVRCLRLLGQQVLIFARLEGRNCCLERIGLCEVGRPEVNVRGVELVRLDRQRLVAREGCPAIRREPVGLARRGRLDEGLVEGEGQVVRGAPGRARGSGRRCRRLGCRVDHPSDPSISSFTSRLNSIAYSIGSSFVNTSRKPWTMRFCASFSVRPRLIR